MSPKWHAKMPCSWLVSSTVTLRRCLFCLSWSLEKLHVQQQKGAGARLIFWQLTDNLQKILGATRLRASKMARTKYNPGPFAPGSNQSSGNSRPTSGSQQHSSSHCTHSSGSQRYSSGHGIHSPSSQHHSPGSNQSFGNTNLESRLGGQDVDDNQDIDMEQSGAGLDNEEVRTRDGVQQRVRSNNDGLKPREKLDVYGKT